MSVSNEKAQHHCRNEWSQVDHVMLCAAVVVRTEPDSGQIVDDVDFASHVGADETLVVHRVRPGEVGHDCHHRRLTVLVAVQL